MEDSFLNYKKMFYDCDGVILDSNQIKTQAFHKVALKYGIEQAEAFVKYHKENGGVSRYKKIEHLLKVIVNNYTDELYKKSLEEFGTTVRKQLLESKLVPGVESFLKKYHKIDSYVVSGGNQQELEDTFQKKQLDHYFQYIGGSPYTKYEIVDKLIGQVKGSKYLFIGDSKLDYEVASYYNMDFLFIHGVSEFQEWQSFFQSKNVMIFRDFNELMDKI